MVNKNNMIANQMNYTLKSLQLWVDFIIRNVLKHDLLMENLLKFEQLLNIYSFVSELNFSVSLVRIFKHRFHLFQ